MKQLVKRCNLRKRGLPLALLLVVAAFVMTAFFAPSCLIKLSNVIGIDENVYSFEMTDDQEIVLKSFLGRTVATYRQSTEPLATNLLCDPSFTLTSTASCDAQDVQSVTKAVHPHGFTYWRDEDGVVATATIRNGKVYVLFYNEIDFAF